MTIHNLGSSTDGGAELSMEDLDRMLNDLLNWKQLTGVGLGEIIDRIQHLSACRSIARRLDGRDENCLDHGRKVQEGHAGTELIRKLLGMGWTYKQIGRHLGCSAATVHRRLAKEAKRRIDHIRDGAEGREMIN